MHSGGQRFDPARLHHITSFDQIAKHNGLCFAVRLDALTSFREIQISTLFDRPKLRDDLNLVKQVYACGELLDPPFSSGALKYAGLKRTCCPSQVH